MEGLRNKCSSNPAAYGLIAASQLVSAAGLYYITARYLQHEKWLRTGLIVNTAVLSLAACGYIFSGNLLKHYDEEFANAPDQALARELHEVLNAEMQPDNRVGSAFQSGLRRLIPIKKEITTSDLGTAVSVWRNRPWLFAASLVERDVNIAIHSKFSPCIKLLIQRGAIGLILWGGSRLIGDGITFRLFSLLTGLLLMNDAFDHTVRLAALLNKEKPLTSWSAFRL